MTDTLLNLFKLIKIVNPSAVLSGSLAMSLQGIELRSLPNDLDLYMPYGSPPFQPLVGFCDLQEESYLFQGDFNRRSFEYNLGPHKIKIDVFQPFVESYQEPEKNYYTELKQVAVENIVCIEYLSILQFKLKHAFDKSNKISSMKQAGDLIHILRNNTILKDYIEITMKIKE